MAALRAKVAELQAAEQPLRERATELEEEVPPPADSHPSLRVLSIGCPESLFLDLGVALFLTFCFEF